jgi:esterase/lipase
MSMKTPYACYTQNLPTLMACVAGSLLLALSAFSCATHQPVHPVPEKRPQCTWFHTAAPVRGVALVAHGLNTKPAKMGPIIDMLRGQGIRVLLVSLAGHRGDGREMGRVTRDMWVSEITEGFSFVRNYADKKNVPVLFAGFSLGCVVGLDAACSQDKKLFDYALYFAPAITLRWYAPWIKSCYLLGNSFVIPSKAPPSYRAYKGTTVAAYKALFHHVLEVKTKVCPGHDVPTLCFIDPKDELVRAQGLVPFLEKKKWTQWKIVYIKKEAPGTYHHLIIDPGATGAELWNTIETKTSEFLDTYF